MIWTFCTVSRFVLIICLGFLSTQKKFFMYLESHYKIFVFLKIFRGQSYDNFQAATKKKVWEKDTSGK